MSKTEYFARRGERAEDRSSGQPVGALPGKLRETRWSGEGCAVWRRVGGLKRGSCVTWVGGCEPQVVLSPLESPTGPRRSHPGLEKVSWGPGGGRLKGQVRGCECWANVSRKEGQQAEVERGLGAPQGAGPRGHGHRSPAGPPGRRRVSWALGQWPRGTGAALPHSSSCLQGGLLSPPLILRNQPWFGQAQDGPATHLPDEQCSGLCDVASGECPHRESAFLWPFLLSAAGGVAMKTRA